MVSAEPVALPEAAVEAAASLLRRGNPAHCRRLLGEVLADWPDHAPALHLSGLASAREGDTAAACRFLVRATKTSPGNWRWLRDLGVVHLACGNWSQAVAAFTDAVASAPNDAEVSRLLGVALEKSGRFQEAVVSYKRSLSIDANRADTLFGLGCALYAEKSYAEAVEVLERCVARGPGMIRAYRKLANLYTLLRHYGRALEQRQAVLRLCPGDPDALEWVAWAQMQTGDLDECLEICRGLIARNAASSDLESAYLGFLLHDPHQDAATIKSAHEGWAARHCKRTSRPLVPGNVPDLNRRLRVGYISGEFCRSPAYYFLIPLFRNRDRSRFEVTCYQTRPKSDNFTKTYEALSDRWRRACDWPDSQLVDRIREDEIDILVDVSGYYDGQKLYLFPLRLAPVQVAYPDYPATTGIPEMDYIVSDNWVCPEDLESQYTERVYRLPSGFLSYEPPRNAPPVSPLPALRDGIVTFGLFQRPSKLNVGVWDAVSAVLRRCPQSRLLVHYPAAELDDPGSAARQRITRELGTRGIAAARIEFRGALPLRRHLKLLSGVDIALDTFPYNGQTTTCECLWMGVPVVTLTGKTHVSRVGYELLDRAGLGRLAATDHAGYVRIAAELTGDLGRLSAMRNSLRATMRRSPVLDGQRVVRELEDGYRQMWRRWCDPNNPRAAIQDKEIHV